MRGIKSKLIKFLPIVLAVVLFAMFAIGCADATKESDKKHEEGTPKYTVTLMVDEKVYKTLEVYDGDVLPEVDAPKKKSTSKKSYTFAAWYIQNDAGRLVRYDTSAEITKDITLYAKFNENDVITVGTAAIYAIIGFSIVVAVLALLVGVFYLSGYIFRTKALSREKLFEFKKKPTEPVYVPEIVDEGDELDVVAAITAAITAILTDENGGEKPEFVIRRVTRKNSK
ncbi:MAG: OadG family protein [Clostridiales bacterium]|nr:OadG family protein [Clostridiales bacterium]